MVHRAKLGIMQPYFFPYIGYFQLIHAVDRFFLYDNLDFTHGSWVNRNRILVVDREPIFLSVPVKQRKTSQTIRDTELADDPRWRRTALRSIERNYRRAPHFGEVHGLVERILSNPAASLAELNKTCIVEVCGFLGLETEILTDSRPFDRLERKLRGEEARLEESFPSVHLDPPDRKVIRALELCRLLRTDVFINAIGGRTLYDKAVFARHDIELLFVSSRPYAYQQRSAGFFADLSIIDVLMNCGREETRRLAGEYDLV